MFATAYSPRADYRRTPMPRATLSLRLPERVWISALSKRYPDAKFTVLAAMPADDAGVT